MADPYIKVTRLNSRVWGVRLYSPDGKHYVEERVFSRERIGPAARTLLRFCDKGCGPCEATKYTDRARHRAWEKASECLDENDKRLRNNDMN